MDILFRAKTYEGEWKEGLPSYDCCGKVAEIEVFEQNGAEFYIVIPETVGQWTGLTDKNGVSIFEGDVVEFSAGLEGGIFKVKFENSCFMAIWISRENFMDSITSMMYLQCSEELEVIGNIHDNPELKGDAE